LGIKKFRSPALDGSREVFRAAGVGLNQGFDFGA
jgi:hypothetical protein